MQLNSDLLQDLRTKEERAAYNAALTEVLIPMQIRALRERRDLDQKDLAKLADMKQPSISRLETPGNTPNLKTLLRLASAFDVGLLVWFVPFAELVMRDEGFSPDLFSVPSYADDPELQQSRQGPSEIVDFYRPDDRPKASEERVAVYEVHEDGGTAGRRAPASESGVIEFPGSNRVDNATGFQGGTISPETATLVSHSDAKYVGCRMRG